MSYSIPSAEDMKILSKENEATVKAREEKELEKDREYVAKAFDHVKELNGGTFEGLTAINILSLPGEEAYYALERHPQIVTDLGYTIEEVEQKNTFSKTCKVKKVMFIN